MNIVWICEAVFVVLWLIERLINYRRKNRRYQYFVGYLTALSTLLAMIFLPRLNPLGTRLIQWLEDLLGNLVGTRWVFAAGSAVPSALNEPALILSYAMCALLMAAYVALKPVFLWLSKRLCLLLRLYEPGRPSRYYAYEAELDCWLLKDNCIQLRTLFTVLPLATLVVTMALSLLAALFLRGSAALLPPYPVFSVLTLNSVFDFLNGLNRNEYLASIGADAENSATNRNYDLLRPMLRRLFGDRLLHEGVRESSSFAPVETNDEIVRTLTDSEDDVERVYGRYLEQRVRGDVRFQSSYARSAVQMMHGQSVLFATPFYRDLSDYLFYPMFMTLLRQKRCMVVIGRDGIDDQVSGWVEQGLARVTSAPAMWRIRYLADHRYQPDVVIVPLKEIHNVQLFEEARECLREVTFVLLLEPSRMIARGQIGLGFLTSLCSQEPRTVFCSTDVNHDGLLDTLSHLLRTSILNVSATHAKAGACSEMLWNADGPYLHHRILSGISHYLGVGAELGLVALKNQIPRVEWKSFSAFPVLDMRWIMQQYYGPICDYLKYPRNQHALEAAFTFSDNLWDLDAENNGYYIVEDELANLFESLRQYSSHISEHGFINILSPNYLLRDYMQHNADMFLCDPKAIPSFAPEHANTRRNCFLSLVMRMIRGSLREDEILRELRLIGIEPQNPLTTLNVMAKDYFGVEPKDSPIVTSAHEVVSEDGLTTASCIFYAVRNDQFTNDFLRMLMSAYYIAEDGQGEVHYLGSRLWGHIYQRYLPGQFYTFGGKYYEIHNISPEHGVMVRRAADHLTCRRYYRQIREYVLQNVTAVDTVAGQHTLQDIRVSNHHADIRVKTAGYYELQSFDDMATARRIEVSGLPDRTYGHKHFLRIELPGASPAVCQTLNALLNEIFATTFPLSREYIAAVCASPAPAPEITTCTESGCVGENCIDIIEDSPIDLGLMTSVERNLPRLLEIAADYLSWHFEMTRPESEQTEASAIEAEDLPDLRPEPGETEEERKSPWFKRLWRWIRRLFGRHRRRRGGEDDRPASETEGGGIVDTDNGAATDTDSADESPEADAGSAGENPATSAGSIGEISKADTGSTDGSKLTDTDGADTGTAMDADACDGDTTESIGGVEANVIAKAHKHGEGATTPLCSEIPEEAKVAADESMICTDGTATGQVVASIDTAEVKPTPPANKALPGADASAEVQPMDTGAPAPSASPDPNESSASTAASDPTDSAAPATGKRRRKPKTSGLNASELSATVVADAGRVAADTAKPARVEASALDRLARTTYEIRRLPDPFTNPAGADSGAPGLFAPPAYPDRAYLNFGGSELSPRMALEETLAYLTRYRFTESALSQARAQQHIAKALEEAYNPRRKDVHFCDFCGCELTAIEYDVLQDGRERCMNCGKTAVRTLDEFKHLFLQVRERMETLYGVHIKIPVLVKMITAEEMARRCGKVLTPSPGFDARAIGVAIRKGSRFTLYIENGAPRMSAASTIAHELTHIWQYQNWDERQIRRHYGARNVRVIYEGMAMWAEIQYLMLIGEPAYAKREEINARLRNDEYGIGFRMFTKKYPLITGSCLTSPSPFHTEDNRPL